MKSFAKTIFLVILLTSLFVMAGGSVAAAVTITPSDFRWQDSANIDERYYSVKVRIANTGSVSESGLIELNTDTANALSFISDQKNCEPSFYWHVHRDYTLKAGEAVTVNLIGRGVPDGSYWPVITHTSGCANSGGVAKQPYGWGNRITAQPIKFGTMTNANDQCDNPFEALQYLRAKGDVNCREAACQDAASTSSRASCTRYGVCADGSKQSLTCSDGVTIDARICADGNWVDTGSKCPDKPVPPPPLPPPPPPPFSGVLILLGGVLVAGGLGWMFYGTVGGLVGALAGGVIAYLLGRGGLV